MSPEAHLRKADPVLGALIDAVGPTTSNDRARPPRDHYGALVRSIVGQQLSTKAARTIYGRLNDRFGGRTPTPAEMLDDDPDRCASRRPVETRRSSYLRSLAEHVLSGELELDRLDEMPDDGGDADLTAVQGIGTWSAHMFLMFQLLRPDVLPPATSGSAGRSSAPAGFRDLPKPAEMEPNRRALAPAPHARLRCLWRSLDGPRRSRPGRRPGSLSAETSHAASAATRQRAETAQTAETSSSSATRNEEPQPQAAITFGLSTLKPAPWSPSTKSITEPLTYGRLGRSTSRRMPLSSNTVSPSRCSSNASAYWKPEQPPPRTPTRSPAVSASLPWAERNSRTFSAPCLSG